MIQVHAMKNVIIGHLNDLLVVFGQGENEENDPALRSELEEKAVQARCVFIGAPYIIIFRMGPK